jgi:hypothetical protein
VERGSACRVLVTEPERKILLRRPMRKFEDNIKIDLEEIVWVVAEGSIWFSIMTSYWLL